LNGTTSIGSSASLTLSTSLASVGDTITCRVSAQDIHGGVATDTASVTIGNSAPSVSGVTIVPNTPDTTSTLTCSPSTVSDPDGDAVTLSYVWEKNGSVITATASTLSASFTTRGDSIRCRITPNDGSVSGTAVWSSSVVIGNAVPVVSSVSIVPASPKTDTVLTASVLAMDADPGDTLTLSYVWRVNGTATTATGASLSGVTWFDKGDVVQVTVIATDGTDPSTPVSSASVTIQNTPPTAPVVSLDPKRPEAGVDDLLCLVDVASTDVDGDAISYTITWSLNGLVYTGTSMSPYS